MVTLYITVDYSEHIKMALLLFSITIEIQCKMSSNDVGCQTSHRKQKKRTSIGIQCDVDHFFDPTIEDMQECNTDDDFVLPK